MVRIGGNSWEHAIVSQTLGSHRVGGRKPHLYIRLITHSILSLSQTSLLVSVCIICILLIFLLDVNHAGSKIFVKFNNYDWFILIASYKGIAYSQSAHGIYNFTASMLWLLLILSPELSEICLWMMYNFEHDGICISLNKMWKCEKFIEE